MTAGRFGGNIGSTCQGHKVENRQNRGISLKPPKFRDMRWPLTHPAAGSMVAKLLYIMMQRRLLIRETRSYSILYPPEKQNFPLQSTIEVRGPMAIQRASGELPRVNSGI